MSGAIVMGKKKGKSHEFCPAFPGPKCRSKVSNEITFNKKKDRNQQKRRDLNTLGSTGETWGRRKHTRGGEKSQPMEEPLVVCGQRLTCYMPSVLVFLRVFAS